MAVRQRPVIGFASSASLFGANLARNFDRLPDAELAWPCDASADAPTCTAPVSGLLRNLVLADLGDYADLDAIVLATPVPTHAGLARQVLDAARKHCFGRSRLRSRSTRPRGWWRRPAAPGGF